MSLTSIPSNFKLYELEEKEILASKLLSPETIARLQHIQTELAETIAEFAYMLDNNGNISTACLIDLGQLRGRRSLAVELLNDEIDARQEMREAALAANPDGNVNSQLPQP